VPPPISYTGDLGKWMARHRCGGRWDYQEFRAGVGHDRSKGVQRRTGRTRTFTTGAPAPEAHCADLFPLATLVSAGAAPEIECIDRRRRWRWTGWVQGANRRLATEHKAASLCLKPGSPGSRSLASMSIKVIATAITRSNSMSRSRIDRRPRRAPMLSFRCRAPQSGLLLARIGLTYGALRV
jgi:hypothetical protein